MKLTIREYNTRQEKNPFRDWLKSLDFRVQARIRRECCDSRPAIWAITNLLVVEFGKLAWISDQATGCISAKTARQRFYFS